MLFINTMMLAMAATAAIAGPSPYDGLFKAHQKKSPLTVDLGYSIYSGVKDTNFGVNSWKGIRYAAPPTGSLRWQPPKNPQGIRPGLPMTAADLVGQEDCLFLSVYAPENITKPLPVLVWIHGGGYGAGNGSYDLSGIIQGNNHGFIGVAIQYRLGAFGFLSSKEVYRSGVLNAGLLDQNFALQWVQNYISKFGGDPRRVTVSGESAGGGSVMLQSMAYGGLQGISLFNNVIAASPYLPLQYGYAHDVPSQGYYNFANAAGCSSTNVTQNKKFASVFDCLVGADSETLQLASAHVSAAGRYLTWGFLPVTDGTFVQQTPSQQLLKKQVNGVNLLVGSNANEGFLFVEQNMSTEANFEAFVQSIFPTMSESDIEEVLLHYPSISKNTDPSAPLFYTNGISGPTAMSQSGVATGQNQRANNLYAEATFICPAYWMAEAFSNEKRSSFKYEFSVPAALHGEDIYGYFGPPGGAMSADFVKAFMSIWGNFIISGDPSITDTIANGISSNSNAPNPASEWPTFTIADPMQVVLNTTGGIPTSIFAISVNITEMYDPGLMNHFTIANAYDWEGGRGRRCDFLRSIAAAMPA
ncbi:hypothetical protein V491_06389 [Pseudogymnoascus sp. VKM F-3775]|nr:hypothetical protein V491_06389 [Pseudogymnoascus sp. VKM F-3775]